MTVTRLVLKNFRCFKQATFDFTPGNDLPGVTVIHGKNGSGKSSLLEALHYGCYLRSFRTHIPGDLAHGDAAEKAAESSGFSVQITTPTDTLSIGVLGKQRSIKVNGVAVDAYNQLIHVYKVVTFIEDDLQCIKGYPEIRRTFIDQALSVQDPHYPALLRSLVKIVHQRTAVIQQRHFNHDQYNLWTEQLTDLYQKIMTRRNRYIASLQEQISYISALYDSSRTEDFLRIHYRQKRPLATPQDWVNLRDDELRTQRTLYGPHLDDMEFMLYGRNSRSFSSRGQQKLAMMLLKIAQARLLRTFDGADAGNQNHLTFLIDDFLTDFDEKTAKKVLELLLKLRVQLIITTPQPHPALNFLSSQTSLAQTLYIDSADQIA